MASPEFDPTVPALPVRMWPDILEEKEGGLSQQGVLGHAAGIAGMSQLPSCHYVHKLFLT